MIILAVGDVPGVEPFVGWVIGGLVTAVVALAVTVVKMALRGVEREKQLAVLTEKCVTAIEDLARAS